MSFSTHLLENKEWKEKDRSRHLHHKADKARVRLIIEMAE
jgi:hypothetical protein